MAAKDQNTAPIEEVPFNVFSGCHDSIISNFQQLLSLKDMILKNPNDSKIQSLSSKLLSFYTDVVLVHHKEEEEELFKVVLESTSDKNEANLAKEYTKRLIAEHRQLEAMWDTIEPDIIRLSKGLTADLDIAITERFALQYLEHAAFEEQYYLPLSQKILSITDKYEVGLSLHLRHEAEKS